MHETLKYIIRSHWSGSKLVWTTRCFQFLIHKSAKFWPTPSTLKNLTFLQQSNITILVIHWKVMIPRFSMDGGELQKSVLSHLLSSFDGGLLLFFSMFASAKFALFDWPFKDGIKGPSQPCPGDHVEIEQMIDYTVTINPMFGDNYDNCGFFVLIHPHFKSTTWTIMELQTVLAYIYIYYRSYRRMLQHFFISQLPVMQYPFYQFWHPRIATLYLSVDPFIHPSSPHFMG